MSSQVTIWVDGRPDSNLPLPDRGLNFGDGLFETILLRQCSPLFPDQHFTRLQRGIQALGLPDCLARVQHDFESFLQALRKGEVTPWGVIRIVVSRGGGPRGYAPPVKPRPRVVIEYSPLDYDCGEMGAPARLGIASVRWSTQPALAGIKHCNRLEQVLAAHEALRADLDDMVMLSQDGHVVSVTAGNLFIVRDGSLITPELQGYGIAGTRRQLALSRWMPALGLGVQIANITPEEITAASEVFYTNSIVGVRPVAAIGNMSWHTYPVCTMLFRQYLGDLS